MIIACRMLRGTLQLLHSGLVKFRVERMDLIKVSVSRNPKTFRFQVYGWGFGDVRVDLQEFLRGAARPFEALCSELPRSGIQVAVNQMILNPKPFTLNSKP